MSTYGWLTIIPILALLAILGFVLYNAKKEKTIDWGWEFAIGILCIISIVYNLPQFVKEIKWNLQTENATEIVALVVEGANCLDESANWTCGGRSREIYGQLQKWNPTYVTNALVRQVLHPNKRLQVLFLSIKLGLSGSEEKLVEVLIEHGNKSMVEDFLNSGSVKLREGGEIWAKNNGFIINAGEGSHRAYWGQY